MDTEPHNDESTSPGKEDALPLAERMSSTPRMEAVQPLIPAAPQQNGSPSLDNQSRKNNEHKSDSPLLVRIIEDDELSKFEEKTVRFGRWGIFITTLSLIAASCAAIFVYQQVQEMRGQTDLLGTAAHQARVDANDSAKTSAEQLRALQSQITVAQSGTKALEGQLFEARRSADIAARQLELTNRPWIKIEAVQPRGSAIVPALVFPQFGVSGSREIPQQVYLSFEVHIKNVGLSTALSIKMVPELFLAKWENGYSANVEAEEKRYCSSSESVSANSPAAAQMLFPGEPFVWTASVNAFTQDNMNFFSDIPGGPYILPVLIGCIDYQFQASSTHHHARFVYEIFHVGEPHTRFFIAGEGVKAEDLLLIRNEADDYAD